jgi:hypothetical protein
MININTAYRDPTGTADWDGSLLTHVNLDGIRATTETHTIYDLNALRYDGDPAFPVADSVYNDDVARRLTNPVAGYLPFDLSDELDLRNRYFLSSPADTRCSNDGSFTPPATPTPGWQKTFKPGNNRVGKTQLYYPGDELDNWYAKLKPDVDHPFLLPKYIDTSNLPIGFYNRRFFSTTLNLDRTIVPWVSTTAMPTELKTAWNKWNDPDPDNWTYRPVDPNIAPVEQIAAAIWLGLPDATKIAAAMPQFNFTASPWGGAKIRERAACMMAVNLVDYRDADSTITSLTVGTTTYYGHESASDQLYITKIAVAQHYDDTVSPIVSSTHYGIELYNPSDNLIKAANLSNWSLTINDGTPITLSGGAIGARTSFIVGTEASPLTPGGFNGTDDIEAAVTFAVGDVIELVNNTTGAVFDRITVPSITSVFSAFPPPHGGFYELEIYYAERDNTAGAIDYQLAINASEATMPILPNGLIWNSEPAQDRLPDYATGVSDIANPPIQLKVANAKIRTIGEFTNVLALGMMHDSTTNEHYNMPEFFNQINLAFPNLVDLIDPANPEYLIQAGRIDLTNANFADIFKYLSVFSPAADGVDNDGINGIDDTNELAVAGRININTAPWFVIAQLPWMQHYEAAGSYVPTSVYERAQAVVADRYLNGAFNNIADVMRLGVTGSAMSSLASDGDGNSDPTGPDFIPDTFQDDLEERDLIFQRISNLVTVRSDLFTAYILVRLDVNGPQKRMIAIFDRSRVFSPKHRPRLIALHPVPDPR